MVNFESFLSSFEPDIKGQQFEHFVKWFLINDPEWSTQVEQIWLWDEYPDRWGRDCGIDLVFKHKNGDMWAVQAKCYSPVYSITKADVDTFLSESNRHGINKRLLIATTDRVGANARQVCKAQEKPVTFFLYSDFEQAAIEYPEHISSLNSAKRKQRPTPRPHQLKAIDAVKTAFQTAERGQLIMACGTGKTFTTLWIKECLSAQMTLVLLPSLSLLSQTLRAWTFASQTPFQALCVCSDESVGKKLSDDAIIASVQDVSFPTTSNAQEVANFLKGSGDKVIFSTYHSSPVIAEAQQYDGSPAFDLVIADEAHRCVGEKDKAFSTVLDQAKIKAKKRLFATATPRTYSTNLKKRSDEMGVNVTGMDDEDAFGKVFHALTFGEAIEAELLTDYQVVIIGVVQPMIAEWIERGELVQSDSGETVDAKLLASQIGFIKAIKDYNLKRVISFHSRVKRAEDFASEIHHTLDFIDKEHRPNGVVWTDTVSGKMSAHKRRLKLDQLKGLTQGDIGLLSNARCLSEGVDVPSLDGVAFIDPRNSQVDIVQAVGRAIRLSKNKTVGTIILPVFIEDGDDVETSLQSSHFKPIWGVINALKSHDEVLSFELDKFRTELGKKGGASNSFGDFSKIVVDLPQTIDTSFADSLKTYLVERTTSSWNFWFGLLEAYVEREGDANVIGIYKTEDGYRLGGWVSKQRGKRNLLTSEQESRLESLDGWVWDANKAAWEEGFSYLVKFVEQEEHAKVPSSYKTEDGYKLCIWVGTQRGSRDKLSSEQESRLESLDGWVWDANKAVWEEGFSYLIKYIEQQGHAKVPYSYKTNDGYRLGGWVYNQRRSRDKLSSERESRLDSLYGWDWGTTFSWNFWFGLLEEFSNKEGHAKVPKPYKTEDGYRLGVWVINQRSKRDQLPPEQKSRLELLDGWVWATTSPWSFWFGLLEEFSNKEGHAKVPSLYKTEGCYRLGVWVINQRSKRDQLPPEQKSRLESLDGWVWDTRKAAWEEGFSHLIKYVEQKGHAKVSTSYKVDGYALGSWVIAQRSKRESLTEEQESKLESLDGWVWDTRKAAWEEGFSHLTKYVEWKGHAKVLSSYKTEDDYRLGGWVSKQRGKRNLLTSEQESRLESLDGWIWDANEAVWEEGFSYLSEYVEHKGLVKVPTSYKTENGYKLGQWLNVQKTKREKLSPERKERLESLGFVWKGA